MLVILQPIANGLSFETFYEREFSRLAGSLRMVVGDDDTAVDLAQEAFARALHHWDRLCDYDRPAGWLYRTAFNLVRGSWRRRRLAATWKPDDSPAVATEGATEDRLDVQRALAGLPLTQREAVVLRHILDYSTEDAAAVMGVSEGAFRMLVHRGVAALRTAGLSVRDEEQA